MRYYKEINGEVVFFTGNILNYNGYSTVNPTEEQMLEAGWLVYQEPEPTELELLQQAIQDKLTQIDIYDNSNDVNVFYLAGQPMWLDALTRQTLRISVESYKEMGITHVTKWFNGNLFTFTTDIWLQMLNALEVYAAEALNATELHKAVVLGMDNILDVLDYDITADYPLKLNFDTLWISLH